MMDFTPVINKTREAQDRLNRLRKSGMYNDAYIREEKQKLVNEIKQDKKELCDKFIKQIQDDKAKIQKRYEKQPGDSSQELLKFQKLQAKIKALPTDQLEKIAGGNGDEFPKDPDELYLLAGELRDRSRGDIADYLTTKLQAMSLEQPWRNDAEYQRLDKKENEVNVYKVQDDMLPQENGEILFIENEIQ